MLNIYVIVYFKLIKFLLLFLLQSAPLQQFDIICSSLKFCL